MNFIDKHQPERLEKIVKIANENKFVNVKYLCDLINVSPSTIRRDLRYLEEKGVIKRFHGGASIQKHMRIPFSEREKVNTEEKGKVAREAIKIIKDNSTIILDAGSTVMHVAYQLEKISMKALTIITPNINIAQLLIEKSGIKTIVTGGVFDKESNSLLGVLTIEAFNKLKADTVIMSCETISSNMEIMYPDLEIIQVRKAVINSGTYKVLVVDSSKFGKFSLSSIGDIGLFNMVITDDGLPDKYINEIKKRNTKLIIAE